MSGGLSCQIERPNLSRFCWYSVFGHGKLIFLCFWSLMSMLLDVMLRVVVLILLGQNCGKTCQAPLYLGV